MGRGVRLACETCDYQATLYEQAALGKPTAAEGTGVPAGGVLAATGSHLCPQCVEPVLVPAAAAGAARPEGDVAAEPSPALVCPRCESPLLDFDTAVMELAAASRSRNTLELRAERDGREQIVLLLQRAATLDEAVTAGTLSMAEARSSLVDAAAEQATSAARASHPWAPVGDTTALAGLPAALAATPDITGCLELMRDRLLQTDRHIGSLEQCVEDEAELPGVPCPRCGTSHLLHWPIWV